MPSRTLICSDVATPHGVDDREPGADCLLGIVFMRLRIPEIDQHAVTHVFGDKAALVSRSLIVRRPSSTRASRLELYGVYASLCQNDKMG
jgi:hypothetical protein